MTDLHNVKQTIYIVNIIHQTGYGRRTIKTLNMYQKGVKNICANLIKYIYTRFTQHVYSDAMPMVHICDGMSAFRYTTIHGKPPSHGRVILYDNTRK